MATASSLNVKSNFRAAIQTHNATKIDEAAVSLQSQIIDMDDEEKVANMQDLIPACFAANTRVTVELIETIFSHSVDDESRKVLAKDIANRLLDLDADNISFESDEQREEMYDAYASLLSSIRWTMESSELTPFQMRLLDKLLDTQGKYTARLLNTLGWYSFQTDGSVADRIQVLDRVDSFIHAQTRRTDPDSKDVRDSVKSEFGSLLDSILCSFTDGELDDEEELQEVVDLFVNVLTHCREMVRPAWCDPKDDEDESSSSDSDEDEDENEDSSDSELQRITYMNANFFESCVHAVIANLTCCDSEGVRTGIVKAEMHEMMTRLENSLGKVEYCGAGQKQNECCCSLDIISDAVRSVLFNYIIQEHPRLASEYMDRILHLVNEHPSMEGISAVNKLYPYGSKQVNGYFMGFFNFGMKNNVQALYTFVMNVARYDGEVIDRFHVDEIEERLLSEKITTSEIPIAIQVLDAISENNTPVMQGRGARYYDAIMRNTEDQEAIWMLTDNILKCIGLLNESEAKRIMELFIAGCQKIPAKSHIASVLENMQSMAMVYRSVVRQYTDWIDIQMRDPYLKKNAVKLAIILKGDPLAGSSDKSSATCTVQ